MTDDPAGPPRYPYVAALLCAACVGMAAWTWMRYSYCWALTADGLAKGVQDVPGLRDRYVRVRARVRQPPYPRIYRRTTYFPVHASEPRASDKATDPGAHVAVSGRPDEASSTGDEKVWIRVCEIDEGFFSQRLFVGRLTSFAGTDKSFMSSLVSSAVMAEPPYQFFVIDTTKSRWHGASIAGLVVGAMGVFVFTVALRHWLGERRAHAASAEDAPPGSPPRPE